MHEITGTVEGDVQTGNRDCDAMSGVKEAANTAFTSILNVLETRQSGNLFNKNNASRSFEAEVKQRQSRSSGSYNDLIDIAASAAVRVLIFGANSADKGRKDPPSLVIYRRMRSSILSILATADKFGHLPSASQTGSGLDLYLKRQANQDQDAEDDGDLEHQELLNESYDSGYSAGFEAGQKAEQNCAQQNTVYGAGFTAGQKAEREHWLREGDYAAAFEAGQRAERDRAALVYRETAQRTGQPLVPELVDNPTHDNMNELVGPLKATKPDGTHGIVGCPYCGKLMRDSSLLRHKRRCHQEVLVAEGEFIEYYPCWWPGCGMLTDNVVSNQLTTHLQRKHNWNNPGDPNSASDNIIYLKRLSKTLLTNIIIEEGTQLNAVKRRIQRLEDELRKANPAYTSLHGLPTLNLIHATDPEAILISCQDKSEKLAWALRELRQLTKVRGLRSQVRDDPGTWWEVADDLEAGLNPEGAFAYAIGSLPWQQHEDGDFGGENGAITDQYRLEHAPLARPHKKDWLDKAPVSRIKFEILIPARKRKAAELTSISTDVGEPVGLLDKDQRKKQELEADVSNDREDTRMEKMQRDLESQIRLLQPMQEHGGLDMPDPTDSEENESAGDGVEGAAIQNTGFEDNGVEDHGFVNYDFEENGLDNHGFKSNDGQGVGEEGNQSEDFDRDDQLSSASSGGPRGRGNALLVQ